MISLRAGAQLRVQHELGTHKALASYPTPKESKWLLQQGHFRCTLKKT